jgi:peptidoglycan/LPS O-acetylase OafA/YrhL
VWEMGISITAMASLEQETRSATPNTLPSATNELQNDHMAHVDGLRALALSGVLMFHFAAPVPGGFLGVDVFFVISGFLMSRAVLSNCAKEDYSIRNFLSRRMLRLCPALTTVIFFTMIGSFVIIPESVRSRLSKSALTASIFVSNWLFASEGGYHGFSSASKPLLHTWSLSVEGQFYVLMAFLLLLKSPTRVSAAITATSSISFVLVILFSRSHPTHIFFLLFGRLYEFGAGYVAVVLYDRISHGLADVLGCISFGTIICCFSYFGRETVPATGWNALPILASTVALIITPSGFLNKRVMSSGPIRTVGKLSYSIYLVHWPAIVLCKFAFSVADRRLALVCAAALTVCASLLLYSTVESRFRLQLKPPSSSCQGFSYVLAVLCAIVVMTVVSSVAFRKKESDSSALYLTHADYDAEEKRIVDEIASPNSSHIARLESGRYNLVLGDSYAHHLAGLLSVISDQDLDTGWVLFHAPNCMPCVPSHFVSRSGHESYIVACRKAVSKAWKLIGEKPPKNLIVSARWNVFRADDFNSFKASLIEFKRRVPSTLIIGMSPLPSYDPVACLLTHKGKHRRLDKFCPRTEKLSNNDILVERNVRNISSTTGCSLVSPTSAYCREKLDRDNTTALYCATWDLGGPIYRDWAGHLSPHGASLLAQEFEGKLEGHLS